jgi:hypothetical protein
MKETLICGMLILAMSPPVMFLASETRIQVKHDHILGSCRGELIFGDSSLEYQTKDRQDARIWNYEDIQQLGLLSPKKLSVLTYEDRKVQLGKDKRFVFEATEGKISQSLWLVLQGRLSKPIVSAVLPIDVNTRFELPVKHQHALGGCQGVLKFTEQYAIYEATRAADSRIWRYEDVSSIGSTGPFQLRLTTMERVGGEYGGEKNFVFDLKRRLAPELYDFVWWKINGRNISASGSQR